MRAAGLWMIIISAMSLLVYGQKTADPGTVATIRALEHEWTEGQSRNDNRALDLIFDNALVYVEYGRLVSKGEYLLRIKTEAIGSDQILMESMMVQTFGKTSIVVGIYSEKGVKRGTAARKRWRFLDTWVYKKNGWVLVAAGAAPALP